MAVVREVCPSCAAPLEIPENASRVKCPYCSSTLSVQRHGNDVALTLGNTIAMSIEKSSLETQEAIKEGSYVTQSELRRIQASHEHFVTQMRLSDVQSEIREIERLPTSHVTHKQLLELRATEADLKQQARILSAKLNSEPSTATPVHIAAATKPSHSLRSSHKALWLLFSIQGRASRIEYWMGIAVAFVLWLVFISIISATGTTEGSEPTEPSVFVTCFSMILMIVFLWVGFAVSAKRYHDLNKPAWWVLIATIPLIGFFWQLIELGFVPGTPGPNHYS